MRIVYVVLAIAVLLLAGGVGYREGEAAAQADYQVLRLESARVAAALAGGGDVWANLSPLLAPNLQRSKALRSEVSRWQRRITEAQAHYPIGYADPDVILDSPTKAEVNLAWEYQEEEPALKVSSKFPGVTWYDLLHLTFVKVHGSWLLAGLQTQEMALLSQLYGSTPKDEVAALITPPRIYLPKNTPGAGPKK